MPNQLEQMPYRPRFVVQIHQSRTVHYDLRFEKDGVFKSRAVLKGIPEAVGIRHLAIQVPDHALEFGIIEGAINTCKNRSSTLASWAKRIRSFGMER
jgi:bifunctional non-homologous end joining protein LigD